MRANDIRTIHAAARTLAFDEDTRRAVYRRMTGQESLTQMSDAQVKAVAAEFRRLSSPKRNATGGKMRAASPRDHVRLVYALWWRLADAGLVAQDAKSRADRRAALNGFINARFQEDLGGLSTDVDFLPARLAVKVAQALKAIAARAGLKLEFNS